jgi:tetratricopeptide (TPR) repeat protein
MPPSQQALAPRPTTAIDIVHQVLSSLVARYRSDEVLTCVRQIPAREAIFRPMPEWVSDELAAAYLCYNLPVLNAILDNPDTRALYLFPTKALAQDQLAELNDLATRLDDRFGVFTYDGDTPSDARKAIRERGHIVLTNPDMLHTGILPHHTKWMRLFENLRYIVLDELHTYRGVFGSHLANVLRRLRRIARFYGSNPQLICCSATIANSGELASQLIEHEVEVVEENGAPAGEKLFVCYNPPMVNRNLGIRRSYINEATRVATELLARRLQTIIFANSRLHTEVMLTYLQRANPPQIGQAEPVRGYRGGYLPAERREIERGLREGWIRGVVATSALELGIDVGSLDASVMAGYAGSIASTWQRAGRAGRRSGTSCAVFVASSAPLDQFIVQHPDYFFGSSPEHGHIQPDNLEILVNHLKCAAFELPLSPEEKFGGVDLPELCELLAEAGFLHRSGQNWHWVQESYPADTISLRSVTSRYRMTRALSAPTPRAHLDFLHPARNLWKLRLGSVRLSQLERHVLGCDRGEDLDSGQIPGMYLDFLRGGPADPLVPVFLHNQLDLRGLAGLAGRILSLLRDENVTSEDGLELFGLSRICERRGQVNRARKMYEQSIGSALPKETDRVARAALARLAKRDGDLSRARELWESVLGNSREGYEAYEQLAIYYEHEACDLPQALTITRNALTQLRRAHQLRVIATATCHANKSKFEHRLARLERKSAGMLLDLLESSRKEAG